MFYRILYGIDVFCVFFEGSIPSRGSFLVYQNFGPSVPIEITNDSIHITLNDHVFAYDIQLQYDSKHMKINKPKINSEIVLTKHHREDGVYKLLFENNQIKNTQ